MLHIINVHTCTLLMCMLHSLYRMLHSIYGMWGFRIWDVTISTRDKFTLPQVYIGACPGGHRPGTADTMPACMHGTLQHHVRRRWDRLQACKPRWHAVRQGRDTPYAHARAELTSYIRKPHMPYMECNMRYKNVHMHIINVHVCTLIICNIHISYIARCILYIAHFQTCTFF